VLPLYDPNNQNNPLAANTPIAPQFALTRQRKEIWRQFHAAQIQHSVRWKNRVKIADIAAIMSEQLHNKIRLRSSLIRRLIHQE
jgi:hypothetical protein